MHHRDPDAHRQEETPGQNQDGWDVISEDYTGWIEEPEQKPEPEPEPDAVRTFGTTLKLDPDNEEIAKLEEEVERKAKAKTFEALGEQDHIGGKKILLEALASDPDMDEERPPYLKQGGGQFSPYGGYMAVEDMDGTLQGTFQGTGER